MGVPFFKKIRIVLHSGCSSLGPGVAFLMPPILHKGSLCFDGEKETYWGVSNLNLVTDPLIILYCKTCLLKKILPF